MNAKVILIKGDMEKTVGIVDRCIYTKTNYKTSFDAEGIYSNTKADLKKRGWRTKPAAVNSIIENADRSKKKVFKTTSFYDKIMGHRIRSDGTVGE